MSNNAHRALAASAARLTCIVLVLAAACGRVAEGASAPTIAKVHALIAADGRARLGPNIDVDRQRMERFFTEHLPESQLNLIILDPLSITGETILEAIAKAPLGFADTFVFYYSGHGQYDPARNDQMLQLPGRPSIYRRQILSAIQERSPRLIVLLTDCCNIGVDGRPVSLARPKASPNRATPLARALFLRDEGVMDLTACRPGQWALMDSPPMESPRPLRGSLFTFPLVELGDENRDQGDITWQRFVDALQPRVVAVFRECYPNGFRGQTSQDVHAYGYPSRPRLGVRAANTEGGGVLVTEVLAAYPGYRAGVRVGDRIVELNGQPIDGEESYSKAVDRTEGGFELVVVRQGQRHRLRTDQRP